MTRDPDARPRIHFTPQRNWMNDPNGLVFHRGRYHLFFQYNPFGPTHANLSWGHASSPDLVTWEEHPVAIPFDDDAEIFSGSVVVDEWNTSGLGTAGAPALVALYTAASEGTTRQAQALAYSTDDGLSWTKYPGNPVLDRGTSDFRDPKVFRYDGPAGSYWVMVTVEAVDRQVLLFRSDDLIHWDPLSTFGPTGAVDGVWECPDLFPLAVDGDPGDVRWVLIVSLNPGGIAGGSGTQYFVGSFDGVRFTPDDPARVEWLDFGRDCYAGVTFAGLPQRERTLIAWMGNWDYARDLPTDDACPRRGAMTLPRRLSLVSGPGGDGTGRAPVLRQVPIGPALDGEVDGIGAPLTALPTPTALSVELPDAGRISLRIDLADAAGFALRLRHDELGEGGVVLRYDAASDRLALDRAAAGAGIHAAFPSVETVALGGTRGGSGDRILELTAWIDVSSIEIFADEGTRSLTDLVYTPRGGRGCSIAGIDGSVVVERFDVASVSVDAHARTFAEVRA